MNGYVLFGKGRLARWGGGVALYAREHLECIELHLGEGDAPTSGELVGEN